MLRILIIAMLAGCYQPSFTNCAVRCSESCPAGQTCGADGFCHAANDTSDCRTVPGTDAAPSGGDAPASGTGGQGVQCDEVGDCAASFVCVGNSAGRSCHELCTDDSQCDGTGGLCNLNVGTTSQKICTTNCNPLTNTGCPASWACHVGKNPNTNRDHTDCHVVGTGTQNASCAKLEDCAAGFACINLSPSRCMKYCIKGGTSTCPGGTTCTSVGGGGYHIAGVEYGICF